MSHITLSALAVAGLCLTLPLQADVIVSSSISLNGLSITPMSGSVMFIPPLAASAFAEAEDSLGGFDQQFNTANDSATSATAATTLASANTTASAPLLTASATSGVNIAGITASASSGANGGPGSFIGVFEITGAAGMVHVNFSAPLTGTQYLTTNGGGQTASSEITFYLLLPDISSSPELFYDNPLTIGPDSTSVSPLSQTLSASVMLQTNTQYNLIVDVDAESSGLNITPEPSLFTLTALGLLGVFVARRRRN